MPAVHAHIDMTGMPVIGKIISHGYLSSGYPPVRIAFPTLAALLLGPATESPSRLLLQAFRDYLTANKLISGNLYQPTAEVHRVRNLAVAKM